MLRKDELKQMAAELLEMQESKKKFITLQEVADKYNLSSRTVARHRMNLMIHLKLVEKQGTHYHIKEMAE